MAFWNLLYRVHKFGGQITFSTSLNNVTQDYFIKVAAKLATANPLCFESAKVKISRKFATSPDILVAKGKNLVANATVLVAISSLASGHWESWIPSYIILITL